MNNLARSFCYWKQIDRNIEDLAKSCRPCCLKQNLLEKVDVHPWLVPSGPWQRIHIDFAGPIYGQYLFVIVDAYSKWVEVIPTKTTTSNWCIQQLRKLFSTFGYPFTLVSDNGPNFTSSIFNQFLQACSVTHKFSAPYHPATNGQAERFVQTVKKQLIAMENDGGDLHFKINHILMSLRNATNATGSSAYELMFGRRIRTRLDLMKRPQDHTEMPNGCTKIKREFRVGDRVQVRNFGKDGKWKFGNVRRREGLVHYQIEMDIGQAEEDADRLIITTAINLSAQSSSVTVVGEDIDILVLLVGLASPANVFLFKPGRGKAKPLWYHPQSLVSERIA
ncbi:uncharacterized protein K02A2.6-like [Macrosteles quadrilineatus]|uniref:uncharacterized protein K02A2.6-like n=1 Tax=Macrosteles quadrilineatus TaxID=74068 RepID=UPI0023E0E356|nr:uncharacterized protein K02A2.6-like [Macrosteles quadrilineatus]